MTRVQFTIEIVLKAVAVGMAVTSFILIALGAVPLETSVIMLAVGLFALAVASLSETESREAEIE